MLKELPKVSAPDRHRQPTTPRHPPKGYGIQQIRGRGEEI